MKTDHGWDTKTAAYALDRAADEMLRAARTTSALFDDGVAARLRADAASIKRQVDLMRNGPPSGNTLGLQGLNAFAPNAFGQSPGK